MSKYGWANDEASFHFERHAEGIADGTKAVLNKPEQPQESLYHNEGTAENIRNFDLIKNQIVIQRDASFDKALLATLTKQEKSEIDRLLLGEILSHNRTCYRYIDCLDNVKKLDKAFISTLTGTSRYEVLMGIYLVNGNKRLLEEITAAAYREVFCFDLLLDIYLRTKKKAVLRRIQKIYSQKCNDRAYAFAAGSKLPAVKEK